MWLDEEWKEVQGVAPDAPHVEKWGAGPSAASLLTRIECHARQRSTAILPTALQSIRALWRASQLAGWRWPMRGGSALTSTMKPMSTDRQWASQIVLVMAGLA